MTSTAELARRRYSCRRYLDRPLADQDRATLEELLDSLTQGPFGSACRFTLLAATPEDADALRGLGTYGFIKGATGFIVGAVRPGPKDMEDCGYLLEQAVLKATDLGLGTCWLGGTFKKSSFAAKLDRRGDEIMPAVVSVGYAAENSKTNRVRRVAKSDTRLSPDRLFFEEDAQTPFVAADGGGVAALLEVVRWAPSASNKQPWRLVRSSRDWHFYLERTPGYRRSGLSPLAKLADLQRVDMGIAMCHFELAARDAGLAGHWEATVPPAVPAAGATSWEFSASWIG